MIARLLDTVTSLVIYFFAATLVAGTIMFGYVWFAWKMDQDKLVRMLAIARGIDLPSTQQRGGTAENELSAEEVSYQEILERRALKFRDLELREMALKSAIERLSFQQRQLDLERQQQHQRQEAFEAQLLALTEGAQAQGREIVRRTLESIKPSQAKEQLFRMLAGDEMDEVVLLLGGMTESKRAKILAEFETPDESTKLEEVLRHIRQGAPQASLAQTTMDQLKTNE